MKNPTPDRQKEQMPQPGLDPKKAADKEMQKELEHEKKTGERNPYPNSH